MRTTRILTALCALLLLGAGPGPAVAGDSFYGTVTEVTSAGLITLDSGDGQMQLRLAGIEVLRNALMAQQARDLVAGMVLGKKARMRSSNRTAEGQMLARLFTDDPVVGIRDVAVELVRAGLARRLENQDFKYGELATAERDAQRARRGVWAPAEEPQ